MRFLIIIMLAVGCGKSTIKVEDSKHEAKVDVVIDWNLDELKDLFIDDCEEKFNDINDIDVCISDKITNFTDLLQDQYTNNNKE